MDPGLRASMFRYYDDRASEYEDAYVLGTGTASLPYADVFRREASVLAGIVKRFAHAPFSVAPEHERRWCDFRTNPLPQTPHLVSPE